MARVSGSNRNDLFYFNPSQLTSLQLRAGRGYDTVKVQGSGTLDLTTSVTSNWRELEALDFSLFTGNVSLAVSPTMLATSNTQALDLTVGSSSQLTLSSTTDGVVLHGAGNVTLSDATANIVRLASSNVNVTGGAMADTITASAAGNRLDGGGGNDVLNGGAGADVYVHKGGSGHDTFNGFNTSLDTIDLTTAGVASWHDLQEMMQDTANGVIISFADGSSITLTGLSTSQLSAQNFVADGQPLPLLDATITISVGTSAAEVNAIIASAPDGAVITFAAGVHTFSQSIIVNRDNITLEGESATATRLVFSAGAGIGDGLIEVGSVAKTYVTTLSSASSAGESIIQLATTDGLAVGDVIYLYQPNTAEYLAANGWTNVSMAEAEGRPFREYITTITAINGNTITLADPLPYDFAGTDTRVFEMDVLESVVLRDFTVDTDHAATNPDVFQNQAADFDGVSAIAISGTNGIHLSNIVIEDAPSIGITLASSINALIADILIDGSLNLGGGGNGYGILLSEAFNNVLSGLNISDVRHSVVFSAWNAEAFNSIQVDFTNRDINFHGSPDIGNVVDVVRAFLDYDLGVDPSVWSLVSGGGSNHAATDIFADNAVRFQHGEGSTGVDVIWGADGGSYLNGHGSNDILIGGNGNDMIVGGLRRDVMTGGAGADTFVFKMGDDLDTITDMEFGAGGDTIVIMGNPAVDGFNDLVFTQDGADLRVRYGSNSTIILKNTTLADVDAQNFVFDPAGTQYMDEWLGG